MSKVVTIGECLIDLVPENGVYVAKAGGAPANVCACVSKLSGEAYYLGKLSTDEYSDILYKALIDADVNTSLVIRDGRFKTAVAKVTLSSTGDRQFSFYRENTADLMLSPDEIKDDLLEYNDILHFCSVGLVPSPSKDAHIKAIEDGKKRGAIISFDVNLRRALFNNDDLLRETVIDFLKYADIVKVTDEELEFVTNTKYEEDGIFEILKYTGASVIIVTKGADGASVYDRCLNSITEKAKNVKVVDTTGAGDAFIGSFLYKVLKGGLQRDAKGYTDYLDFAIKASSIVCTRYGALSSMPTILEVESF